MSDSESWKDARPESWQDTDLDETWYRRIPTHWRLPTPYSTRGYWEWWRGGVIEGYLYGSPLTYVADSLIEHDPHMADAYIAGLYWVWNPRVADYR